MPNDRNNDYETAYYNAEEVRRQSAAGGPKKKKKKSKRANQRLALYLACVVLGSCLLAGIGWLLFNDLCSLNKDYVEVKITVDKDDSVGDVAKKLKDAGLINYRGFFKFCGLFFHAKSTIDPGEWKLNSDMDYRSLIQNMHDYEADKVNKDGWIEVVIPEGKTVNEIIDIMVEAGISTREELEDACANFEFQSYSFLKDDMLGKVNRMEGFLFPTTQAFDPEKTAVYDIDTMLTNFVTIRSRINRMEELEAMVDDGRMAVLPKKEQAVLGKELTKLQTNLGGARDMKGLPQALFVIDTKREENAIKEAQRLNIPVVALIDTNSDPDEVEYGIPCNDDAISAVTLMCELMADACLAGSGKEQVSEAEMAAEPKAE